MKVWQTRLGTFTFLVGIFPNFSELSWLGWTCSILVELFLAGPVCLHLYWASGSDEYPPPYPTRWASNTCLWGIVILNSTSTFQNNLNAGCIAYCQLEKNNVLMSWSIDFAAEIFMYVSRGLGYSWRFSWTTPVHWSLSEKLSQQCIAVKGHGIEKCT